jgi:nucleotide-binding universal stress UspA family protein
MKSATRDGGEQSSSKSKKSVGRKAAQPHQSATWNVVLAGLDGSPRAPDVFRVAAEIAIRFSAELHVVRVIAVPPDFPPAAHTLTPDPLPEFLEAEARRGLAVLLPPDFEKDRVHIVVHQQAWRGIILSAEEITADVVVIGSHGYAGFDRILGTTAGKVVNHAHCHVLVIHER